MQALEYYFNPYLRKDYYLKVFEFKPPKKEFFHLGHLYLIIEFQNTSSKDKKFIEEFVNSIRQTFYSNPKLTPKKALSFALKKANSFLAKKLQEGKVAWVGNFNVAILNLANFFLYFSRGGSIQILLLRGEELSDIAQDLEEKITPSPLRFFGGVASGKLISGDIVMVVTQKLFENLYDKILPELINLPEIKDKTLKKFFKSKRKEMKKWMGVFFVLLIEEKAPFLSLRFSALRIPKINKTLLLFLSLLFLLVISYFIFQ